MTEPATVGELAPTADATSGADEEGRPPNPRAWCSISPMGAEVAEVRRYHGSTGYPTPEQFGQRVDPIGTGGTSVTRTEATRQL